jgi:DNA repair protein RecN (Recombination protein N)
MLVKLSVQNYALIERLDINLENGLTIITGETGAGKSILLGALSLILGTRADTSVLLKLNEKCIVEGTFRIEGYDLYEFFKNNELDYDSHVILRREINTAGKSRAFINDTPVTINILKELADRLIDIHSQHQNLMLNENSFQLNVIDSYAGNGKIIDDYKETFLKYRKFKKEFSEIKEKSDKNKADLEYYQFQLNQIEEARLKSGEYLELENEQEILSHAEEIKLNLTSSSSLLSEDANSILTMLRTIRQNLSRIIPFLREADAFHSRVESSFLELNDLANEIEKLSDRIEADPKRLTFINDRLDTINTLIQKHRVKDVDQLLVRKNELSELVSNIVSSDERLEELEILLNRELDQLKTFGYEISENRNNVLSDIESYIESILRQLGIPNAKFKIELKRAPDFNINGIDIADFLFSANKQIPPENLARIASGGELSRVMLSLKSLLTKNKNLPTIIFDEIDSGVSGEVADMVGQILSDMAKYMQVINITHLPQVAIRGKNHFHVFKDDIGDATVTRIKLLTADERVFEVAKLLSGSEVTESALQNARELFAASGT